jgi:xanthine dehydrogenase FAD-binding subunit
MLDLQQGRHPPVHTLVDLTCIPEMTGIEIRGNELFIGAVTPLSQIAASPLVKEHAQALTEACSLIAGPQVRNVATLGGNVAHALPAADGTIALTALGTQALVVDQDGSRRVPLLDLFLGPGETALKIGWELLEGFTLPLRLAGQASAFKRVMRAQGIALPILNLAIWLERRTGSISQIRISVGPSGPTPLRFPKTEETLCSQPFTSDLCEHALVVLLEEVHFRTSPHRASAEYRQHLAGVLLRETLQAAWQRAS